MITDTAGTEEIRAGGEGEVRSGAHHDAGDWARAAQEAPVAGGAGRCRRRRGSGGGGAAERHVESGKGKDSRRRQVARV